jgi:hypothetical protein
MTTTAHRLLGKRFLLLEPPTTESRAVAAVDVQLGQNCIALFGDATSAREAELLIERGWFQAVEGVVSTPTILAHYEQTDYGSAVLMLSRYPAPTLADVVRHERTIRPIQGQRAREWAVALIDVLMHLPEMTTWVPRLTLDTILVLSDRKLGFQRLAPVALTPETEPVRQIYRLLYLLLTGIPYQPTVPWGNRPIQSINPTVSKACADLIKVGLTAISVPTLQEYRRQLTDLPAESCTVEWKTATRNECHSFEWREVAIQAGNHLATTITAPPRGLPLYGGLAGDIYVLAESLSTLQVQAWHYPLRDATKFLTSHDLPVASDSGSLYMGQPGIALALIRAGEVLGDQAMVADGLNRARCAAEIPHHEADLLLGAAGRLRFQVWVWRRTNNPTDLKTAESTARWLIENAFERNDIEGYFWRSHRVPADSPPFLGYGHGIAGIGDALLDLYRFNHDPTLWAVIERIATTLHNTAVPILEGQGVNWHKMLGDGIMLDRWCHGAPGIGHFLLNLTDFDDSPRLRNLTRACLDTTAYGSAYLTPCLCHGLAGSIELLLHGIQTTGDPHDWCHIRRLWGLLDDFRDIHPTGISWRNHHFQSGDSALMTGSGGVLLCLLRLLDPQRPRLII